MATRDQIAKHVRDRLRETDPNLDTEKGPFLVHFVDPHVNILAAYSGQADRLVALTGPNPGNAYTPGELRAIARQLGIHRPVSRTSSGTATFFLTEDPGQEVNIFHGALIGDLSSQIVYRVVAEVNIPAGQLKNLWNPVRRRYEVQTPIEALQTGEEAAVPPFRLRRILTPIPYVVGVENESATIFEGFSQFTQEELINLYQLKLIGSEHFSRSGFAFQARSFDQNLRRIAQITAADRDLFSWRTERPAIDLYVIGEVSAQETYSIIVDSGLTFKLPQRRLLQILSVKVNGEGVPYTLIRDNTPLSASVLANNSIRLAKEPEENSSLEIKYSYNSLLGALQDSLQFRGSRALFGTDFLVFAAERADFEVELEVTVPQVLSRNDFREALQAITLSYFNSEVFGGEYSPNGLLSQIKETLPTVQSIVVKRLRLKRKYAYQIETVALSRKEYAALNPDDLTIQVRG